MNKFNKFIAVYPEIGIIAITGGYLLLSAVCEKIANVNKALQECEKYKKTCEMHRNESIDKHSGRYQYNPENTRNKEDNGREILKKINDAYDIKVLIKRLYSNESIDKYSKFLIQSRLEDLYNAAHTTYLGNVDELEHILDRVNDIMEILNSKQEAINGYCDVLNRQRSEIDYEKKCDREYAEAEREHGFQLNVLNRILCHEEAMTQMEFDGQARLLKIANNKED